jgi:hypothetical protein
MQRPNRLHEELDALLDGRAGEVPEDLAPLLEAADALQAELAELELDPQVVDRHLERVLGGSAKVVPLPTPSARRARHTWRRRMAAAGLAAALVVVPASVASASSLPGQALYPFKLAVEQARLGVVQWSPTLEATERTRVANTRLLELDRVVDLRMMAEIPPAIRRADQAVAAAGKAVEEAMDQGADRDELAALTSKLQKVREEEKNQLRSLIDRLPSDMPVDNRVEITVAVLRSQDEPPALPPQLPPVGPVVTDPPPATNPTQPPVTSGPTPPNPTGTTPPPVTDPTTTAPPVTSAPTTTLAPPTTAATPAEESTRDDESSRGESGRRAVEDGQPPETTGP